MIERRQSYCKERRVQFFCPPCMCVVNNVLWKLTDKNSGCCWDSRSYSVRRIN